MIQYSTYKLMHFFGIFLLFMSLGGATLSGLIPSPLLRGSSARKNITIAHGLGLFLVLLGGFGMLARLGIMSTMPGWVIGKIIIWALLGGLIALILRKSQFAQSIWIALPVLGCVAAYLGIAKPF